MLLQNLNGRQKRKLHIITYIRGFTWELFYLKMSGADQEGRGGEGAQGAHADPFFASNSFKNPLNWPKYAQKLAPSHLRPLLFQILDPP